MPRLRVWLLTCMFYMAAALVMVSVGHETLAQTFLNEDVAWPGLTRGDVARIHAAAARLYEGRSIGAIERWQNPHSKNAGEIKLVRSFTERGMPCRTLDYATRFNVNRTKLRHATVNWCMVQKGDWKIVELDPPH